MGHVPVRRVAGDDYPGCCPFHRDCLEGLASGPAIEARWGADLSALGSDHEGLPLIANYLGQLVVSLTLVRHRDKSSSVAAWHKRLVA